MNGDHGIKRGFGWPSASRAAISAAALFLASGRGGAQPASQPEAGGTGLGAGLEAVAKAILPRLRDEAPFLVSPDGRQLLIKTELSAGNSELRLEELGSGRSLGRYTGGWPLLIGWRPKSTAISFVEDNRGDHRFRAKIWTPSDGKVAMLDVPPMDAATRFMRWSPDGRYLALCVPGPDGRDQLRIFDADEPAAKSAIWFEAAGISGYDWSADGKNLAVFTKASDGKIVLIDRKDQVRRDVTVSPGATLRQLAWFPDGRRLLVAGKERNQDAYSLREVDLAAGTSRALATPEGELDLPAASGLGEGRFLFDLYREGLNQVLLGGPDVPVRPVGFDDGSTSLMAVDRMGEDIIVAHTGITEGRALYRIQLAHGVRTLLYSPSGAAKRPAAAPVRIVIPLPNGGNLPVYVWRAQRRPARGAAIEFPVNRAFNHRMTDLYSGGDQYLVEQGFDYLKFDYPPGEDVDGPLTEADIRCGLATVDYARESLGIPANKLVLFGRSFATSFVVRTAARLPDKTGGLVFEGVVSALKAVAKIPDHRFRIALLQGESDPLPPAAAKALVEDHFGAGCLDGANGLWRVVKDEAHSFRLLRSKALVHAAVLQLLAAPP